MNKSPKIPLEKKIALCQEYTQLWAKIFACFSDGFENRRITAEDEAQFFKLVTEAARREFRITYTLGKDFDLGDDILEFLGQAVSLSALHELGETDFNRLQHDWHVIFIALNKFLGRLLDQRPVTSSKGGQSQQKSAA